MLYEKQDPFFDRINRWHKGQYVLFVIINGNPYIHRFPYTGNNLEDSSQSKARAEANAVDTKRCLMPFVDYHKLIIV